MILLSLLAICTIVFGTDAAICGDNVDADMSIMETFDPWLIRTIGYECVNNTHFIGDEEYCESALGTVGLVHGTYARADGLSCFQCGDSGSGAAVCSNPDEPPKGCFQGEGNQNSKKLSPSSGCLVGDMMFMTGQLTGSIGFQCHDPSLVEGQESICGSDGEINTKRKNFTCPEEAPYCFHCGEAAYGAALCLSDASFDEDGCVLGGTNLSTEPSDTASGCLVGGVMYSVGQSIGSIGYLCYDDSLFYGQESFCGSDGKVFSKDQNFTCPKESPYCFQCGESSRGAAICLSDVSNDQDGCVLGGTHSFTDSSATETGCLVGGVVHSIGQSIGSIGYLCHDDSVFYGQESFCGTDGKVFSKDQNFTCPEVSPYCFQCGKSSRGAAICLSDASATQDECKLGGNHSLTDPSDTASGCLVGGVMYSVGQSIGSIGYLCHDDSVFYGQESFCGSDRKVFSKDKNFTCPEESPYCFQCGESSRGAAICLSDASATRDGCKLGESHSFTDPSATETGCLVGDVMFPAGQSTGSIGFFCFDNNYFYGQESFCGSDGIVYHQDKVLKCPEESPYCYQCGDAALGAVICLLDSTISPEGCSYGVSLVSAFNGTIGNSSNQTGFEFDVSTQTSLGNSTVTSSNNSTKPNATEARQEDHFSNIRFPAFLAFFAFVWNLPF